MNIRNITKEHKNFIFLGEAGSGKSEIAVNFSKLLVGLCKKSVHFFDMDMTKPLFRSRDVKETIEREGVVFHHQEQFMDAPTQVGGVVGSLKDEGRYVVMDVGGDHIGARSVGAFAHYINSDETQVYYVLNIFRPWSFDMEHIDETLGKILGVSHIGLKKLRMINNPNSGRTTTKEEFISGSKKMSALIAPYTAIDFACVREDIYEEVKDSLDVPIMPLHLYLTYPWN